MKRCVVQEAIAIFCLNLRYDLDSDWRLCLENNFNMKSIFVRSYSFRADFFSVSPINVRMEIKVVQDLQKKKQRSLIRIETLHCYASRSPCSFPINLAVNGHILFPQFFSPF